MAFDFFERTEVLESGLVLVATDEKGNHYVEEMKAAYDKVKVALVGEDEKKAEYVEQGYVIVYVGENVPKEHMENEVRLVLTDDVTEKREKMFQVLYQLLVDSVLISIDIEDLTVILKGQDHYASIVDCSGLSLEQLQEDFAKSVANLEYEPKNIAILSCGNISMLDIYDRAECISKNLSDEANIIFGAQYDENVELMFVLMN